MERTRKGQLVYHEKTNRFGVIIRGGSGLSLVNFNNEKVKEEFIPNKELTKDFRVK